MTTALETPQHLEFILTLPADKRAVLCALIAQHDSYDPATPTDITGYGQWAARYCSSLNHHPTCSTATRSLRRARAHKLADYLGDRLAHAHARDLSRAWDELF